MSFAASTASGTERSPSMHASRRTEKTTSRDFFAPVKEKLSFNQYCSHRMSYKFSKSAKATKR